MKDIERNIRNMQNEMTKLNTLITKEKGTKDNMEQSNILMEDEFIRTLKVRISDVSGGDDTQLS
jgi:hypothetical protein